MASDELSLEIVTPERLVLSEGVDEVILPSVEGYMGIRPGHTPLLARLDVGEISYRKGDEEKVLAVSAGFVEVLSYGVSILAETCEMAHEIDVDRARRSQERAESRMKAESSEFHRAEISMRKATSRIRVHERGNG